MRNRTADLLITNQLLYQLSYGGFDENVDCGLVVHLLRIVSSASINFMVKCQELLAWLNCSANGLCVSTN